MWVFNLKGGLFFFVKKILKKWHLWYVKVHTSRNLYFKKREGGVSEHFSSGLYDRYWILTGHTLYSPCLPVSPPFHQNGYILVPILEFFYTNVLSTSFSSSSSTKNGSFCKGNRKVLKEKRHVHILYKVGIQWTLL